MSEVWKPVVGYEGWYEVSNRGSVRSVDRVINHSSGGTAITKGKMLSPSINGRGYKQVILCVNGARKIKRVHQLVAESFIDKHKENLCVNHKDGNKLNNRKDNLEWCTMSENIQHAYDTGLKNKGEDHYNSVLTSFQVRLICVCLRKTDLTQMEIAKIFGISRWTLRNIKAGKTWRGFYESPSV